MGKKVVAVDAGGTHLRAALVHFDAQRRPVIENWTKARMPGTDEPLDKEAFYDGIAYQLGDLTQEASGLGFCFSYPTDIQPSRDGMVVTLSKEIEAPNVVGTMVGAELASALERRGVPAPSSYVVLNDTVAALLAGQADTGLRQFSDYVGFILGTGTNTCYVEDHEAIAKLSDLPFGGRMIINVESGAFAKAPQGALDVALDATTGHPGEYVFEKMISGAYLGPLTLIAFKAAAADGLFCAGTQDALLALKALGTEELHDFLTFPPAAGNPLGQVVERMEGDDASIMFLLAEALVERAARFSAGSLAACVLQSGRGVRPEAPVLISAEGTTVQEFHELGARLRAHLQSFLTEGHGRYWEIAHVENAPLLGAAIAGLT